MESVIEEGILSDKNAQTLFNHKTKSSDNLVQNNVAKYDKTIVTAKLQTIWNNKQHVSIFNLKYFSSSIFGKTWHIILAYLVAYYTVQVPYQLGYLSTFCANNMFPRDVNHNNTQQCDQMIVDWFTHWREYDRFMLSTITFLLGFFVNTIVKRWWEQVSRLPTIEPITLGLSGLVWPNENPNGGEKSVTEFRKTVLRYCILSWAMAFRKFSNLRNNLYSQDDFIKKGLLTSNEYTILSRNGEEEIWWFDQWWLPLTWATNMVNKAFNQTQIVPKDHKDLIGLIVRYQKDLDNIIIHANNPVPLLYSQAVHVAVWAFWLMGVISGKIL